MPKRLPCSTAPKAGRKERERERRRRSASRPGHAPLRPCLTIDDDHAEHRDGEEGGRRQLDFDQDGRQQEDGQDERQAARHAHAFGNASESQNAGVSGCAVSGPLFILFFWAPYRA